MSLAEEFNGWYRKSFQCGTRGAGDRFVKLVKRLKAIEARPTFLRQEVIARMGSAAEERGVSALQSGEAPSQQLKPKMPSLSDFIAWCSIQGFDLENATASYMYIARHFGH